jgi:nitrogen fixation-related uncharacterized protein
MTSFVLGVLFLTLIVMAAGTLYAFTWATRNGQMSNLSSGSEDIFDHEESVGVVTDLFPDRKNFPEEKASFIAAARKKTL